VNVFDQCFRRLFIFRFDVGNLSPYHTSGPGPYGDLLQRTNSCRAILSGAKSSVRHHSKGFSKEAIASEDGNPLTEYDMIGGLSPA